MTETMAGWLAAHSTSIITWCAALCTFAIYSVLYAENKFYRLFEHIYIGLACGYGVYTTWSEILRPKWWIPMVYNGQWYWIFAAVAGSMFYFMYSNRHVWISRIIFGFFMGVTAGGMFRAFYEVYFPQIGSSMKPLAPGGHWGWDTVSAIIFYVLLFSAMTYFFFSFEHKHPVVATTAKAGRWFLMIGFGAIFGATVMGRLTLLIGRLNFLINDWWKGEVVRDWQVLWFKIVASVVVAILVAVIISSILRPKPKNPAASVSEE